MVFRIQYFGKGVLVGAVSSRRSILEAREIAKQGIKLHGAEFAKILDMESLGLVLEIVKPDA